MVLEPGALSHIDTWGPGATTVACCSYYLTSEMVGRFGSVAAVGTTGLPCNSMSGRQLISLHCSVAWSVGRPATADEI